MKNIRELYFDQNIREFILEMESLPQNDVFSSGIILGTLNLVRFPDTCIEVHFSYCKYTVLISYRRQIDKVMKALLLSEHISHSLVKPIMAVFKLVHIDPDTRVAALVETISDIREPISIVENTKILEHQRQRDLKVGVVYLNFYDLNLIRLNPYIPIFTIKNILRGQGPNFMADVSICMGFA